MALKHEHAPTFRSGRQRAGLSILEVMLALAILGLAVTAIGQLIHIGSMSSVAASHETTAQMICESKLAEITSGIQPTTPLANVPFELDDDWNYSIQREEINDLGLVAIQVTVEQRADRYDRPVTFSLIRWVNENDLPTMEEVPAEDGGSEDATRGNTTGEAAS